jgi:hypothetical protein
LIENESNKSTPEIVHSFKNYLADIEEYGI